MAAAESVAIFRLNPHKFAAPTHPRTHVPLAGWTRTIWDYFWFLT